MRRIAAHLIVIVMVAQFAIGVPAAGLAQETSSPASPSGLPATPVGEALAWVLTLLNDGGASLTPEEMIARFAPAFMEAVPPEIMVGLTQQMATDAPFTLQGFTRPPTANQINALLIGRSGTPLVVPVAVEPEAPHRITGMNFVPVPPPPGVHLPVIATDEAPLAEGELRTTETGRLDGLFDVDGHQIYLSCVGTGSPTVVLESGHNDPAAPWFAIERAVAPSTRVCSYDRPNTAGGASDPVPTPVTAQDAANDLHDLLAAANVPGPYVLVGHSLGELINRLYASTYPDEVAGLVLFDASHEEQDVRLEALVSPELWEAYQDMMANVLNIEKIDFAASFVEVRDARVDASLRSIPLVVMSAGAAEDPSMIPTFFPPEWPVEAMPQLHRELQADLAELVPDARQVIALRSGHYVHQAEPELVVEAIRDVVDAVRDPEMWDTSAAGTPTRAAAPITSLDTLLEESLDRGLTGVALAVNRDGEVLFDGATGLASREDGSPLASSDRFRIYSITKTFTAVLILQLVDEGVLSLDDTVADWLDDPAVARIPNIERITLRQLLTHTSGVYDYFAEDSPFWQDAYLGEDADWSRVWTPEELLAYADGAIHAPDFTPGKGVHYSNTGYILLGLIVEEATGQGFADRLQQQILDPLGLADTVFAATEPVPGGTVQGYHLLGDELVNVTATHLSAQGTEGGMVSSTRDLLRFADAVFDGELLQLASMEEMFTFVPSERPGIAWGMGVARMHTAAGDLAGMAGDGPGFAARMFRLPEADLTVVVLTNTNRDDETVDVLFEQIVQVALGSVG
jgi:D-alanyl-D-alanine carboxypeptidase